MMTQCFSNSPIPMIHPIESQCHRCFILLPIVPRDKSTIEYLYNETIDSN